MTNHSTMSIVICVMRGFSLDVMILHVKIMFFKFIGLFDIIIICFTIRSQK